MLTWFNSEEDAALQGLPILTQLIYLRAIRRFMDAETLLVGTSKRRISYQSIIETVYVEPNAGREREPRPTTKKIRVALAQLEKASLIQSLGGHKYLVFKCVLAASDFQAQKKQGINGAQKRGTKQGTKKPSDDGASAGLQGSEQGAKKPPFSEKEGTPQISNNNYYYPPIVPPNVEMKSAMDWAQFFVQEYAFLFHEVQTAKTMPMFSRWVDQKVTVEEARAAVEVAHRKNNGRAGSPVFYRNFVEAELRKRSSKKKNHSSTRAKSKHDHDSSQEFSRKYGHIRIVRTEGEGVHSVNSSSEFESPSESDAGANAESAAGCPEVN